MTRSICRAAFCAFVAAAIPLTAVMGATSNAATPSPTTEELLRQVIADLTGAETVSFHVEILLDRIDSTGQKLQFAAALDAEVRRPDHLRIDYMGDLTAKRAWYDGDTLTIFDPDHGVYAEMPGSGDVASTLQAAGKRYGVTLPLADLLRSDLMERIDSGVVARVHRIGLHDVGGEDCHHLAIRREHDDLQIWIRAGDRPRLCKLVFTYIDQPGSPQFMAVFSDWDLSPRLRDKNFKAKLPKDAVRASFLEDGESSR
jgi:hypothetical protein